MDKCPKCGALVLAGSSVAANYICGTIDKGEKTDQSLRCRVRELEKSMRRLLAISKRIMGGFIRYGDMIVTQETVEEFQAALIEADAKCPDVETARPAASDQNTSAPE